jgi:hypothetical protein
MRKARMPSAPGFFVASSAPVKAARRDADFLDFECILLAACVMVHPHGSG